MSTTTINNPTGRNISYRIKHTLQLRLHTFFGRKVITSLSCCYGNVVTMAPERCAITRLGKSIFSSYSANAFLIAICITILPGCYGNTFTMQ